MENSPNPAMMKLVEEREKMDCYFKSHQLEGMTYEHGPALNHALIEGVVFKVCNTCFFMATEE